MIVKSKYIITSLIGLVFWGCFVLQSCSPNLYQLKQYEKAAFINTDTLFVPLVDRTEEIALLRKYNEDNKANQWQRRDSTENAQRVTAFKQAYNFSPVAYISEQMPMVENRISFIVTTDAINRDNYNEVVAIRLPIKDTRDWMVTSSNYSTFSKGAYKNLAFKLNQALEKAYEKAK